MTKLTHSKQRARRWLSRFLMEVPFHWALCVSEKDFHEELSILGISRDRWPDHWLHGGAHARVYTFDWKGYGTCKIVCVEPQPNRTADQIVGLLAHEATHLWQAVVEELGEVDPSPEFEAYSIQHFTQCLCASYREQTSAA